MIESTQFLREHLKQQAGGVVDEHRAEDHIGKTIDRRPFTQAVNEELAEASSPVQ